VKTLNFTFIELTVAKVSFVKLGTFSVNVGYMSWQVYLHPAKM